MLVSDNENKTLKRITQLKMDLAGKEAEAARLLDQYIAVRRSEKASLRTIGAEVGLSHTQVRMIAKLNEAAKNAGQN